MRSQGSPSGRFQRALATGSPALATAAAAELPRLTLADALSLLLVYRDAGDWRFERAAVRWHARLCLELRTLVPHDAHLALAAVTALSTGDGTSAAQALRAVLIAYGLDEPAAVLTSWLERPRSERLVPRGGGGRASD